jgi:hypothetical protein
MMSRTLTPSCVCSSVCSRVRTGRSRSVDGNVSAIAARLKHKRRGIDSRQPKVESPGRGFDNPQYRSS